MLPVNPTFEDLRLLDLNALLDLLTVHTELYTSLIKKEGFSSKSDVFRKTIVRIQSAIEQKIVYQNIKK